MSDESSASTEGAALRSLVAQVAAAYFTNSHVATDEIPSVIAQISASLSSVSAVAGSRATSEEASSAPKLGRAQIRKSITSDALISFEDNKSYKTLRRHLAARGLTPAEYRAKWGLPDDYPMVAPSYSAARSEMAKTLGLGQRMQAARGRSSAAKGKGGRRKAGPAPVVKG
jgi:predicted transcriptional regulator